MNTDNRPVLYGIGVGPGDPELVTLKAVRYIRESDIIILPGKDEKNCRAYQIAVASVPEIKEKECIFMPFPMTMNVSELEAFHKKVAEAVISSLDLKKNVAFLTIGDPSVYSTFSYIRELVSEAGYEIAMIPGVASFLASASELGVSLADGSECIHVIPGSAGYEDAMSLKGTRVFMKSGKRLTELKMALADYETNHKIKVYSVSNCGMDNEEIHYGVQDICDASGYLTVVIVKDA